MQINQQKCNPCFKGVIAYLAPKDSSRELREKMFNEMIADERSLNEKDIETDTWGYIYKDELYLCHGEDGIKLKDLREKSRHSEFKSEESKALSEFLDGLKYRITQVKTFTEKPRFWKSKCSN